MKYTITYIFILLLLIEGMLTSCEKENYTNPNAAKLAFSTDTVMFDTIFTTLGSTTKSFRVKNPYNRTIKISDIKLGGGNHSPYKLNIDGEIKNESTDVELRAKDSIFIFVQVTIDPNGVNQPMLVQDSVLFTIDGNQQHVRLIAYGQDFVPIRSAILKTTTWTADKPYLVFDYALIDTLQTLTIEPGTRIFLHDSAGIVGIGNIIARGTPESPIIFQGDRLEKLYEEIPDQWGGIRLNPNPAQSVFENVVIKNGMVGLQVGHVAYEGGVNLKLHNVKIQNMTYYGLYAVRSTIEATNTLITDCGYYCAYLIVGGNFSFTHCTMANYWSGFANRKGPAVALSNQAYSESKVYKGDLVQANWSNCIIYGSQPESELTLANNGENAFNINFDHCLVKVSDSLYNANSDHFKDLMRQADPLFISVDKNNYMPDSLSPVRDYGLKSYAEKVPFDLANISRLNDLGPDIGAYEYIYTKKEDGKK